MRNQPADPKIFFYFLVISGILFLIFALRNIFLKYKFKSNAINAKPISSRKIMLDGKIKILDETLKSPISNKKCFGYLVIRLTLSSRFGRFRTYVGGKNTSQFVDFILETSYGRMIVKAKDLNNLKLMAISPKIAITPTYLYSNYIDLNQALLHSINKNEISNDNLPKYQYQEYLIEENSTVCVEGFFQHLPNNFVGEIYNAPTSPLIITYGQKNLILKFYNKKIIQYIIIGVLSLALSIFLKFQMCH